MASFVIFDLKQLEGTMRLGYFNLMDGHQFYSVWLFTSVRKVTDRNDPAYVVEKPQLRFVPEIILECFRTYAVGFDSPRGRYMSFISHILRTNLLFSDMECQEYTPLKISV
jgi:hypothetical protein